jgi:hypothetical protein
VRWKEKKLKKVNQLFRIATPPSSFSPKKTLLYEDNEADIAIFNMPCG